MRPIVLDLETFFSDEFTLSKLSTENYIRDARFIAHGAAVKWSPDQPARWYDEPQLRLELAKIDWSDVFLICWHNQFDGLILSHHYGVVPKMYGCPMSMARLLHPAHISVALDNIRKHYGMPGKTTPYNAFRGKHWHELSPDVQDQVARGAEDEVESIWDLFVRFAKDFPPEEFEVIDSTVRMFVNPVLGADTEMLAKLWESENARRSERAAEIGVLPGELQSADKFKALLEVEGIEIEYKAGKNGPIPAFAKTDDFMRDLLEHDSERVRSLAEARLGMKSTILQTRAETFGWMASRGALCVYLRYCGASTLRPSGGDGSNWLNMSRGSAGKPSPIRPTILAPKGYWLAPVDASQIECRCLNVLAGQDDMVEKFRRGEDPYVGLASVAYGEKIYKAKKDDLRFNEMEQKRGMGKQGELMCGYGAAAKQFKITAKNGLYGPSVDMPIEEAERFVRTYRDTHPAICGPNSGYWAQAGRMLARLAGGPPVEWGPLTVRDHKIFLPNGTMMHYDSLEHHVPADDEECRDFERSGYWRVRTKRGWKKMWGSKLVQNICEAVSRVIVTQAMVRIKRMGIRTLNHPYDELLLLIPQDAHAEQTLADCKSEMTRQVSWLPEIPLDCDGSLSERYSK